MGFLKKHYEKIILSLVFAGLAGVAFWFSQAVSGAKADMAGMIPPAPKPKPYAPINLTAERAALAALTQPPPLELSGRHNLFNPVTWKMKPNGEFYKVYVEGAEALQVTTITPVYWTLNFDRRTSDESYRLTVIPAYGRPSSQIARVGEQVKGRPYVITNTADGADGSTTLQIQLDNGDGISLTTNQPYKRVDNYEADFKYPPDSASFRRQKTGDVLRLSDEPYKIIAITNNAVRVEDTKNSKTTTIQLSGGQ